MGPSNCPNHGSESKEVFSKQKQTNKHPLLITLFIGTQNRDDDAHFTTQQVDFKQLNKQTTRRNNHYHYCRIREARVAFGSVLILLLLSLTIWVWSLPIGVSMSVVSLFFGSSFLGGDSSRRHLAFFLSSELMVLSSLERKRSTSALLSPMAHAAVR